MEDTGVLPWYRVWIMALINPRSQTFVELTNQPKATKERAYAWVFIGSIGFALSLFSFTGLIQTSEYYGGSIGTSIFLVFGFVLITVFIQAIAVVLGGKGNRSELSYAFSTYIAPIGIICGVVSFIPLLNNLVIPLVLYVLILNTIATKAVHQFDWGQAIICNTIVFAVVLFCVMSFYQFYSRFLGI